MEGFPNNLNETFALMSSASDEQEAIDIGSAFAKTHDNASVKVIMQFARQLYSDALNKVEHPLDDIKSIHVLMEEIASALYLHQTEADDYEDDDEEDDEDEDEDEDEPSPELMRKVKKRICLEPVALPNSYSESSNSE
jgi:hypothetical protein